MSNVGKSACDFMDRDLVEYWKNYVENGISDNNISIEAFVIGRNKDDSNK